jgi:hypothetical protein
LLRSRSDDDKREAVAKLRQIGVALYTVHDLGGRFPVGILGQNGQLGLSWRVSLLPYLGEEALYKQFKRNEPWDSEHNKALVAKMPKVFEAPGTIVGNGKTFLRSFSGPRAFLPAPPVGPKGAPSNPWAYQPPGTHVTGLRVTGIPDGTSNTLMVVEATEPVEWTKPEDLTFTDRGPGAPEGPLPKLGGLFTGGFHGLMCDGEVRFYSANLSEKKLRALITVSGGEVLSLEPSEFQVPPRERPKRPVEGDAPVRPPYGSPPTRR